MGLTKGISHIGLSVQDVEEAKDFFVNILEFSLVHFTPKERAFVSDGSILLTLWETAKDTANIAYAGLHHLALQVESVAILDKIERKLRDNGYKIQFDGMGVRGQEGGNIALFFFGPSNIRIELATNEKDTSGNIPIIGGCSVTN